MSKQQMEMLLDDADSLAEFVEAAAANNISYQEQAAHLKEQVWQRDVPKNRMIKILRREQARLDEYEDISLNTSSRSPRYMDINDLDLVSGYEFEHVLAELLRRVEGSATVTEASGDQGVDVVWLREHDTIGIQAKAYDLSNPVGNSAVQEIHTGSQVRKSDYSIDSSAVVTTSKYTNGAREAAEHSGVVLYNRSDVERWLSEAKLDAEAMGRILDEI